MHYIPEKAATEEGDWPMKTELMQLRLQPEEKQAFQQAADLAGIPLSAWARERLRRAARIELQDSDKSVPFLHPAARTSR